MLQANLFLNGNIVRIHGPLGPSLALLFFKKNPCLVSLINVLFMSCSCPVHVSFVLIPARPLRPLSDPFVQRFLSFTYVPLNCPDTVWTFVRSEISQTLSGQLKENFVNPIRQTGSAHSARRENHSESRDGKAKSIAHNCT